MSLRYLFYIFREQPQKYKFRQIYTLGKNPVFDRHTIQMIQYFWSVTVFWRLNGYRRFEG